MTRLSNIAKRVFTDKKARFSYLAALGFYNRMPDEEYLRRLFKLTMGYELDLDNPKTFNEKLQWLKLHDRNPEYTIMVDKVAAKKWAADRIGEEYIIPTLGVWDDPDEIDFDALPDQFVLKCNHNSGLGMCICKDKSKLDIPKVKRELRKGLRQNYYLTGREWPYKDVPRKILAEQYMVDESGTELKDYLYLHQRQEELFDYKFMCFDGRVRCSFVCNDRFSGMGLKVTFYDREWNVMPFERHYPKSEHPADKPATYDEMVELAEKLAKDLPFVRVDFYEVQGRCYFGEMTLYPGNGVEEFTPSEWDLTLGSWLKLPSRSR